MHSYDLKIGKAYKTGVGRGLVVSRCNILSDSTAALTLALTEKGIIQPFLRCFEDLGAHLIINLSKKVKDEAIRDVLKHLAQDGLRIQAPEFEVVNGVLVPFSKPYTKEEQELISDVELKVDEESPSEIASKVIPVPVPIEIKRDKNLIWLKSGVDGDTANSLLLLKTEEVAEKIERYLSIRRHPSILACIKESDIQAYAIHHTSNGPFAAQGGLFICYKPELISRRVSALCKQMTWRQQEYGRLQGKGINGECIPTLEDITDRDVPEKEVLDNL